MKKTEWSTHADVLAVIGVGGMGVAVARRMGAGRVVVLGDVNTTQVDSVAEHLTDNGHHVVTGYVDVTSRESVAAPESIPSARGLLRRRWGDVSSPDRPGTA